MDWGVGKSGECMQGGPLHVPWGGSFVGWAFSSQGLLLKAALHCVGQESRAEAMAGRESEWRSGFLWKHLAAGSQS